jgi:Family of unknown function (DUF5764)
MEVLNDAERRFSRKLIDAMLPELVTTFWTIWDDTKKETKDRKFVDNYRQNLRKVKSEWSNVKVKEHVANIMKECPLFPRLIAAVFVIHVKILSSIRIDKSSKKISLKLPSNDVFVHTCFIECARDVYEDPWIITEEKSETERRNELNTRFTKCIRETIENLVPTEEILNTYLTLPENDTAEFEMEHGDDDVEEGPGARPDLDEALDAIQQEESMPAPPVDDAPPVGSVMSSELPNPVETPGGTKTVAVTPAQPVHKETLFPDAPETGKKGLDD